eukprot:4748483-Pleurochrysis_carterae.AAC.1
MRVRPRLRACVCACAPPCVRVRAFANACAPHSAAVVAGKSRSAEASGGSLAGHSTSTAAPPREHHIGYVVRAIPQLRTDTLRR